MAEIVVIDPSHVTVDGVNSGCVLDVPVNYANVDGIRSLVLNALLAWRDECDRCHGAHCKALQESHAAEVEELASKHQSMIAAKDATIADLQAQVNAFGGTELAQRLSHEAACQAARDQIAAAQAILDTHGEAAMAGSDH